MIFAVAGTQLPFPRLFDALSRLAADGTFRIVAQTAHSSARYNNLECHFFLEPLAFRNFAAHSDVIVAHAGIGTLITAARFGKPLVVMPRRAALGEHRNDHQAATARRMNSLPGITVVWDSSELGTAIACALQGNGIAEVGATRQKLIQAIRDEMF